MQTFKLGAAALAGLFLAACMPTQAPTLQTTQPGEAQARVETPQPLETTASVPEGEEQTAPPPRPRRAAARPAARSATATPAQESSFQGPPSMEGETPAQRSWRKMDDDYRRWDRDARRAINSICNPC